MKIPFLKTKKKFTKKDSSLRLNLYWDLAICFACIAIIFSCLYGYNIFTQINTEPPPVVMSNGHVETVKKERIDKILQDFSERKIKSNLILNSAAPVVDPSL